MKSGLKSVSALVLLALSVDPLYAFPATSDQFDDIIIGGTQRYKPTPSQPAQTESLPRIAALQVLLDRRGFSPGVIDGRMSNRVILALDAHNQANPAEPLDKEITTDALDALLGAKPAFASYTITAKDVAGPFTPHLPALYINQANLPQLGYRNAREALAERFHIDEDYLTELNPTVDFSKVGATIIVPDIGRSIITPIARIVADKTKRQVRAYDNAGKLVAAYPASIGSTDTPSPSGTHTVINKAENPGYTYDPNGSAQPGLSKGLVRLPAGPNGPVGNAWIGLSKRTYGIHGTPEPSQIGITASVGCVRLTNWDALELAIVTRRGVAVNFID